VFLIIFYVTSKERKKGKEKRKEKIPKRKEKIETMTTRDQEEITPNKSIPLWATRIKEPEPPRGKQ
jgi:hypothetical protein